MQLKWTEKNWPSAYSTFRDTGFSASVVFNDKLDVDDARRIIWKYTESDTSIGFYVALIPAGEALISIEVSEIGTVVLGKKIDYASEHYTVNQ